MSDSKKEGWVIETLLIGLLVALVLGVVTSLLEGSSKTLDNTPQPAAQATR